LSVNTEYASISSTQDLQPSLWFALVAALSAFLIRPWHLTSLSFDAIDCARVRHDFAGGEAFGYA
jgi:hypothetical protein